jgi:predicted helicase
MAPYAVAHLKLGLLLKEKGFDFPPGQRLGVYLTNTLDEGFKKAEVLPLAGFITEESNSAARIKKEDPIEVVLGNPPYAVHSANASIRQIHDPLTGKTKTKRTWIGSLIEDYKQVDDKPLEEQNPKMLHDDYVKFLRWGQWRITQTGRGVLAMITNHGYLDNPTFRGMRQQLMQSFSEIYLLNLHGNARKKEVCPDGSKDENVFDIQQGVAIGMFVKKPGEGGETRIFYTDLWGLREDKYAALAEMKLPSTQWQEFQPVPPYYLFIPQDTSIKIEYERFWKVTEIFQIYSTGVKTHRDHFVIDFDMVVLRQKIIDFRELTISDEAIRNKYDLSDTRDWKLGQRRKLLANDNQWDKSFTTCLYRHFDFIPYYHHNDTVELPKNDIMQHMFGRHNFAIITTRQTRDQWSVLITTRIINHKSLAAYDTNYLFPLYLYHKGLFEQEELTPNLNPNFLEDLAGQLRMTFVPEGRGDLETTTGPEDVFSYAYAVLYSPTYRKRYSEFLKGDFPRLPLTSNKALFAALVSLGAELASLHLMESPALDKLITRFPVAGSQVVEEVHYLDSARRVYINSEQYFEGVPPDVWGFTIGGYQVCHKWLKDRKGRTLTFEDLHQYQKIIVALAETIRLMAEIDAAIDAHGGWPMD